MARNRRRGTDSDGSDAAYKREYARARAREDARRDIARELKAERSRVLPFMAGLLTAGIGLTLTAGLLTAQRSATNAVPARAISPARYVKPELPTPAKERPSSKKVLDRPQHERESYESETPLRDQFVPPSDFPGTDRGPPLPRIEPAPRPRPVDVPAVPELRPESIAPPLLTPPKE